MFFLKAIHSIQQLQSCPFLQFHFATSIQSLSPNSQNTILPLFIDLDFEGRKFCQRQLETWSETELVYCQRQNKKVSTYILSLGSFCHPKGVFQINLIQTVFHKWIVNVNLIPIYLVESCTGEFSIYFCITM